MGPSNYNSLILTVLSIVALFGGVCSSGKMCYECYSMSHPRDCNNVVECGSHQVCYVKRYVTSDAHVYYNSGCLSNSSCNSHHARREKELASDMDDDVTASRLRFFNPSSHPDCSSCCHHNYCNTNLCETHKVNSTRKRCLSCDSVEHLSECQTVRGCDEAECCIKISPTLTEILSVGEKVCDQGGTVHVGEIQFCSQCCTDENCNRELCKGPGPTAHTSPTTFAPVTTRVTAMTSSIPATACEDSQQLSCASEILPIVCADEVTKFHCRKSCQICDLTVPPTSHCVDLQPLQCNNQTMLASICANKVLGDLLCRKSCGICHDVTPPPPPSLTCKDDDPQCFSIPFLSGVCSDPSKRHLCRQSCSVCT